MPDQYRQGVEMGGHFLDISLLEVFLNCAVVWEVTTLAEEVLGCEEWCLLNEGSDVTGTSLCVSLTISGVG